MVEKSERHVKQYKYSDVEQNKAKHPEISQSERIDSRKIKHASGEERLPKVCRNLHKSFRETPQRLRAAGAERLPKDCRRQARRGYPKNAGGERGAATPRLQAASERAPRRLQAAGEERTQKTAGSP